MVENKQQSDTTKNSNRKRILEIADCICGILLLSLYLLVFIKVILTGYLSWIGLAVGAYFAVLIFIWCILSFVWKKQLKRILGWFLGATFILIVLTAGAVLLWPEGNHTWRPYPFDDELASIEAKRAVPDSDNVALLYESVFAVIDANDWPDSLFRKNHNIRTEFTNYPWKATDFPEVSQWLDSHSNTIDKLLLISKMEKCRWPVQIDIHDDFTVTYEPVRRSGQLITVAGNRDLGEGSFHKAMEKSFCLLRMAQHLYQQTHKLEFYFGFAYEGSALQQLRYIFVQSDVSDEDIEHIASHMPTAANNWDRDTSRLLEFEKFRFAHMMASVYDINKKGKVRFAPSFRLLYKGGQEQQNSTRKGRLWRLYWLMNMPLDPQGVWDMAEVESIKFKRFLESGPIYGVGEDDIEPFPDYFCRMFSNIARRYAIITCFDKVTYNTFGDRYAKCMTRRRGTWLVLGLRKYRNLHGHWPKTLGLISEYVPPEAFIDPMNNGSFVYKLTEENFTLYSQGKNGIDEGGRWGYVRDLDKHHDDIAIWPLTNKETRDLDNDRTKQAK